MPAGPRFLALLLLLSFLLAIAARPNALRKNEVGARAAKTTTTRDKGNANAARNVKATARMTKKKKAPVAAAPEPPVVDEPKAGNALDGQDEEEVEEGLDDDDTDDAFEDEDEDEEEVLEEEGLEDEEGGAATAVEGGVTNAKEGKEGKDVATPVLAEAAAEGGKDAKGEGTLTTAEDAADDVGKQSKVASNDLLAKATTTASKSANDVPSASEGDAGTGVADKDDTATGGSANKGSSKATGEVLAAADATTVKEGEGTATAVAAGDPDDAGVSSKKTREDGAAATAESGAGLEAALDLDDASRVTEKEDAAKKAAAAAAAAAGTTGSGSLQAPTDEVDALSKGKKKKGTSKEGESAAATAAAAAAGPAEEKDEASGGKEGGTSQEGVEQKANKDEPAAEMKTKTGGDTEEKEKGKDGKSTTVKAADDDVEPQEQQQPAASGKDGSNAPDPSTTGKGLQPPMATKSTAAAAGAAACDATETCNGHGKCNENGSCICFPPFTGSACLRDACLDIYDCNDCLGSTLGCYFIDGECRGDGLMSPEESTCRPQWLSTMMTYMQFAFLFGVVLLVAGGLVWRSRRASQARGGFLRLPTAALEGGENWNWDPEEDSVELLKQQAAEGGDGGRAAPHSEGTGKGTGIYALIRPSSNSSPARPQHHQMGGGGLPPPPPAAGMGVSSTKTSTSRRASSGGKEPPSAEDLFAELGMEAQPQFTSQQKHSGASSPGRHTSTTRSNRLSAAGTSPVKGKGGGSGAAPGWMDDDDLEI